ncbi:MAG: hypothetical protein IKE25_09580 [Clostridia bacterium]|nr:hypothetical protein [Clostridia bacterium]
MQFVVNAHDGKNMLEKRMEVRPRHLENMTRNKEHVVCAGGILDEAGKPIGSVLVLDFESRDQLDAYLAGEPYIIEKVWEDVKVEPLNVVIVKGEKVGK